jgi:hypothetical protein
MHFRLTGVSKLTSLLQKKNLLGNTDDEIKTAVSNISSTKNSGRKKIKGDTWTHHNIENKHKGNH